MGCNKAGLREDLSPLEEETEEVGDLVAAPQRL